MTSAVFSVCHRIPAIALYTVDTDVATLPCGLMHPQSKIHLT